LPDAGVWISGPTASDRAEAWRALDDRPWPELDACLVALLAPLEGESFRLRARWLDMPGPHAVRLEAALPAERSERALTADGGAAGAPAPTPAAASVPVLFAHPTELDRGAVLLWSLLAAESAPAVLNGAGPLPRAADKVRDPRRRRVEVVVLVPAHVDPGALEVFVRHATPRRGSAPKVVGVSAATASREVWRALWSAARSIST
jgi:hypothetical protein